MPPKPGESITLDVVVVDPVQGILRCEAEFGSLRASGKKRLNFRIPHGAIPWRDDHPYYTVHFPDGTFSFPAFRSTLSCGFLSRLAVRVENADEANSYQRRLADLGIDEFTNRVWCLVFSMIQCGIGDDDPWWGQDFLAVKQMLEQRGLNCDPLEAEGGGIEAPPGLNERIIQALRERGLA